MSIEVNILFSERPAAVVVPLDAVVNGAVQAVTHDHVRRVPITTGVRGTRFVEITGNVSPGDRVLSPARTDVADTTLVRIDSSTD